MSESTPEYNISFSRDNLIEFQHIGVTAKMQQQQPLKMLLRNNYNSSSANDVNDQYSRDIHAKTNSSTKYNKFSNENCTECTDDKEDDIIYLADDQCSQRSHCDGVCNNFHIQTDTSPTTDHSPTPLYRMKTIDNISDSKYYRGKHKSHSSKKERKGKELKTRTPSKIEFQLCSKKKCPIRRSKRCSPKRNQLKRRLFIDDGYRIKKCHKRCKGVHLYHAKPSLFKRLRRSFENFYEKCNEIQDATYKTNLEFDDLAKTNYPSGHSVPLIDHVFNDIPDIDDSKMQPEQQQQHHSQHQKQQQQQQQQQPLPQQQLSKEQQQGAGDQCKYPKKQFQQFQQHDTENIPYSKYRINNKFYADNRVGIYPFDHGCPDYLRTYDLPPQVFSAVISEQTVHYTTRFWAEIFGSIHIAVAFIITFILQAYRFILFSLINTLFVGIIHMTSDYFIKPLLAVVFNGFIQPPLIFVYNVFSSIRDLLSPIADMLNNFMKPIATVGNSLRLVQMNSSQKRNNLMKNV